MNPTFETTQDGLVIIDPIERHRYALETDAPATPTPVAGDRIPYPMDSSIEITAGKLTLPKDNFVYVRRPDRSLIAEVGFNDRTAFPRGEYVLDLSGPPKVYAAVDSSVDVYIDSGTTEITFGEPTSVVISARSYHTRPAETITTPAEPTAVMRAISTFGSALKSTTAERSYPTLRGHPPALELGDELHVPDGVDRRETGVRIEVPPTLEHAFAVAPLAYYLSAAVVPGPTPRLVTDSGYSYAFDAEPSFATAAGRVLQLVFFLDCVVRTEGETPLRVAAREAVESALEFDLGETYERPIAEQLETYLEVPFATVEPHLPDWWLETDLPATAAGVEFLPFVANDLSLLSITSDASRPETAVRSATRSAAGSTRAATGDTAPAEQPTDALADASAPNGSIPTVHQRWRTDEDGTIASTKPLAAFRHAVDQSPREGPLTIEVVCNDPEMNEELVTVYGTYGERLERPFDVTIHHDLATTDLEAVLTQESDFVHYIGHVDADGFRCTDGTLDASTVDSVGAKAFFLNACRSYEQGLHLVEAGSIGGIVTLTEILNGDAVDAGRTIAQLLNYGFPLYALLDVLQRQAPTERRYHIVGDSALTLSQHSGAPTACIVERTETTNEITIQSYITSDDGQGGIYMPYVATVDAHRLLSKTTGPLAVTKPQLVDFLNTGVFPVLLGDELRWSDDIKIGEL